MHVWKVPRYRACVLLCAITAYCIIAYYALKAHHRPKVVVNAKHAREICFSFLLLQIVIQTMIQTNQSEQRKYDELYGFKFGCHTLILGFSYGFFFLLFVTQQAAPQYLITCSTWGSTDHCRSVICFGCV